MPDLVIMLKLPRAGQVKTRLGRDIGNVRAAWWFRHQTARLIRDLSGDRRWRTVLGVAPDVAGIGSRIWPAAVPRLPQGRGDLGRRMVHLFEQIPRGPVVLVGGDIPAVRRSHIARAFRALGRNDAVFGPAADGGFWLVGLKHPRPLPRGLFDNVRWSGRFALGDALATLPAARIALIDCLRDVDVAADMPG